MPMPLGVGQMAVQHRHRAEAGFESLPSLWREADLGDEHDRLPAVAHDALNGLYVDLGLAAAGDTVEQNRLMTARLERAGDRVERPALVDVQLMVLLGRNDRLLRFVEVQALRDARDQPFAT